MSVRCFSPFSKELLRWRFTVRSCFPLRFSSSHAVACTISYLCLRGAEGLCTMKGRFLWTSHDAFSVSIWRLLWGILVLQGCWTLLLFSCRIFAFPSLIHTGSLGTIPEGNSIRTSASWTIRPCRVWMLHILASKDEEIFWASALQALTRTVLLRSLIWV